MREPREVMMRPRLSHPVSLSCQPTAPPRAPSITETLRVELAGLQVAMRSTSRHPTMPSPPPRPSLLAMSRPTGKPEPRHGAPHDTEHEPAPRSTPQADVLAVYDRVCGARSARIRAKSLRVQVLAPTHHLPVDERLLESVLATLLDIAVGASPRGGRVDVVARAQDREELVVSFAASSHFETSTRARAGEGVGPREPVDHGEHHLDVGPELHAKLDACRVKVSAAGGELVLDADDRCTTLRVVLPRRERRPARIAA